MLPTLNTIAKIQKKYTRVTESQKSVTSLQLSVGEKNSKGEYDNFYFDATFWEKSADFVDNYFNEGDFIGIKGDLITTNYAKEDGTKVYKTEVKFPKAFFPSSNKHKQTSNDNNHGHNDQPKYTYDNGDGNETQMTPPTSNTEPTSNIPEIDIDDSELPF